MARPVQYNIKNEDGKALALGSMKVNVNISKTTDEGV